MGDGMELIEINYLDLHPLQAAFACLDNAPPHRCRYRARHRCNAFSEFVMPSIRILAVLALVLSAPALAAPLLPAASACGSQSQVEPQLRVKNTARWTTASRNTWAAA